MTDAKQREKSRWWEELEERETGDCMPLTITFPVFFYAHTLGKTFREISPAHTVLHKQRQEDWEKEHNHQHGMLKQEMATLTRAVVRRTSDTLLPSSLAPCTHSGEQSKCQVPRALDSQPFLVQLITMNNTILITSYWSLQVLKVLCKWQHEMNLHKARGPGVVGISRAQLFAVYSINWNSFTFSKLTRCWTSHLSCSVCLYI